MSHSSSRGFLANLFFGLILAGVGTFLAWHHPLGGFTASALFLMLFVLGTHRFPFWLVIVPAAMPVIGLAPWSGWVSFEEFDLLVLAMAGGAYLRLALPGKEVLSRRTRSRVSLVAALLIMGFVLSVIASMLRGFGDAGGFVFGWYQGYYESMNSIRLAKSFFLALCLLPLWTRCCQENQDRAASLLSVGIALGLGLASLATIWERLAFTGLLNFSTDYRTTALFWEMHVGGAALDGLLALSVPFAVWAFLSARSTGRLIFFGSILALAAYACLTTFSRGVYLAIPVGLLLMLALSMRNTGFRVGKLAQGGGVVAAFLLLGLFGGAAIWIFPTSGYRGMLALCISVALFYPVSFVLGKAQPKDFRRAMITSIAVILFGVMLSYLLPKGAYLIFALGSMSTVAALWLARGGVTFKLLAITMAGYFLALAGCVLIASHWGGEAALGSMLMTCLLLLIAVLSSRLRSLPERSNRWHAALLCSLLFIGFSVATFSGGSYMTERFSTSQQDMTGRLNHWKAGLGQLDSTDGLLGKGLGRYPASHFFAAPRGEHPGGYRLVEDETGSYLLLSGGQHVIGWGELYRVTQRVSPGTAPYSVSFDVRTEKDIGLHFEVCEKHLLYNGACATGQVSVKGSAGQWKKMELQLKGSAPDRGSWYAPNLVAFSVAMGSSGELAYIDNLALLDGFGENLLANGNFSDGMAHWFSSSDRHHMPWHMKSLFFHTLFDQGVLGFSLLSLMVLVAFWRLTAGSASRHPMAPALVGGMAGFLIVGLFDSLLDVPRLATLFYWLLMIGLIIQVKRNPWPATRERGTDHDLASQGN